MLNQPTELVPTQRGLPAIINGSRRVDAEGLAGAALADRVTLDHAEPLTGDDNPYENDTREARAWIMGLLDGRQRQLTVVQDN
jgi:hypothetical protein